MVFCHYSHRSKEVIFVALPRVRSCTNREMRERKPFQVSFVSPPKSLIDPESKQNNSRKDVSSEA